MEVVLSLYRRSVAADIKDTLQPANAHTLQRMLYESSDIFGQLCKYDNFHRAFGVPPNPCENVSFITFWKGVEDVITGPESVIGGTSSIELQKALFVEDALLRSMRYFRDELLKQSSPMTTSAFFSVIENCGRNSEMEEFWSRVRENSRHTFSCGTIDTNEVSDMIFGHLCQRFSCRPDAGANLRTISTCISLDAEDDLRATPSTRSLVSDTLSGRSATSYDDRYRQLLEDLDVCLPAVYNRFCERIDELTTQREQLENECEIKEKQLDDLRSEFAASNLALKSRCDQLLENNTLLHRKIESQELELDSCRIHMDNMKRRLDSYDTSRLDDELQTFKLRCESLEQVNADLRNSLNRAESIQTSICTDKFDRIDACVGVELEYSERNSPSTARCDECSTAEDRTVMLQELEGLRQENVELSDKVCKMRFQLDSLSRDLDAALRENAEVAERMMRSISSEQHKAEQQGLKDHITSLELEVASLRDQLGSMRKDSEDAETQFVTLQNTKLDLERELTGLKAETFTLKNELDVLRHKCTQLEAEGAAASHLQRQLQEYRLSNSELQSKLDALTKENYGLVARIDELTAPPTDTTGVTGIDDYPDSGCSAFSPKSDITDFDGYEEVQRGVPSGNMIKINPALAETRRLNTLNAMKHGQLNLSDAHVSLSSFNSGVGGPLVYRQVFGFQRSMTVLSDEGDIDLLHDPRDLGLDSDTASLLEDDPNDVLQSAASYISDTFNIGLRAGGNA
ncbi:uncharacterized protein BXIN_1900 [Babesia sp. Xinjiang]|uniref:uncharacterized protein n=1 Tax=Babesia sp. Xinjiang TaxID=462227 RepID=UPI000A23518F|nr:uncharacterized protein BXIN_1900 [Babesia sp. Xinjiang]ORM40619.1 hypothetical protein BXIN_1900 [Babesia sp. Xinjiang]